LATGEARQENEGETSLKDSTISHAHSVEGASHKRSGKPCQDSSQALSACQGADGADGAYRFVAVADGHGGDAYFRSDVGSRLAVDAARERMTDPALIKLINQLAGGEGTAKERESHILHLKKSILARWNALVSEHIGENPFSESELKAVPEKYAARYRRGEKIESAYGSTLIAVLWAESFFLAVQIGDGSCATMDAAGAFCMPVPIDENCFLNVTPSICDTDALGEFRHHYSKDRPAAVVIATDGIDDSFGFNEPSSSPERLYDFYRVVLGSFAEKQEAAAWDELTDYLPRLSAKGSGDDISIGIIADLTLLPSPAADAGAAKAAKAAGQVPILLNEICKEFKDNRAAADEKYKGKQIQVTAKIRSIGKFNDKSYLKPSVELEGLSGDLLSDKLSFAFAEFGNEDNLAPLKKGQTITISCAVVWAFGSVELHGCKIIRNGAIPAELDNAR
jgi:hypothetical protein